MQKMRKQMCKHFLKCGGKCKKDAAKKCKKNERKKTGKMHKKINIRLL